MTLDECAEATQQPNLDPDAVETVKGWFEAHPDAIEGMDEDVFCRIFSGIAKIVTFWGG